ncbi:hypothetical protein BH11ACT6_BH11ACT6_03470 [soil metagenome]
MAITEYTAVAPETRNVLVAASARAAAAAQRVDQLKARRQALAQGVPVTRETVEQAQLHAQRALERALRAHRDAAQRHQDAAGSHHSAAAAHEEAAMYAGDEDVDAHQEAAERHRHAAAQHQLAAQAQLRSEQKATTRPLP